MPPHPRAPGVNSLLRISAFFCAAGLLRAPLSESTPNLNDVEQRTAFQRYLGMLTDHAERVRDPTWR